MTRRETRGADVCRLLMRANEACLSCRLVGESNEGERSRDLAGTASSTAADATAIAVAVAIATRAGSFRFCRARSRDTVPAIRFN